MIIGRYYRIEGNEIKNNDQYKLTDNRSLKTLVVSYTELKKGMSTNGHSHPGVEEVYIFTNGHGTIQVGTALYPVEAGMTVSISDGDFHKVVSGTNTGLDFIAIFQSYERAVDKDIDPIG
jgi:mannose-6-phosphate isomerase-like protein (cupin superfamily)